MIRRLSILIIVLTTVLAGPLAGQSAVRSLIKARYLVSENEYAEAVAALANQQFTESDRIWSDLTMGQALAGLKKIEESNTWLLKVHGAAGAEANYCLAKNAIALNDYNAAIGYLSKHLADLNHYQEKQIRLDPDFSVLENNREWIHLWQKDWYSEVEQKVAEGLYLLSKDQVTEAAALVGDILKTAPSDARIWFLKAKINQLQKEGRLFHEAFDRAWQLSAENVPLKTEMLYYAVESGYYDKIPIIAADLIQRDPTNPEYLITRSLVRILDGKENLATKEIETLEENGIAPAELYYQAGRKISATSPLQADSYLTKAIDAGIMDARFYFSRGIVRNDLGKTSSALDDLAMSLDINPNQPDLYMDRAKIRMDLGDTEGACHDWKRALEMGNKKAADLLYKNCRLP